MAGGKLTIKLTEEQQNEIKAATGEDITELNIDAAATGKLAGATKTENANSASNQLDAGLHRFFDLRV